MFSVANVHLIPKVKEHSQSCELEIVSDILDVNSIIYETVHSDFNIENYLSNFLKVELSPGTALLIRVFKNRIGQELFQLARSVKSIVLFIAGLIGTLDFFKHLFPFIISYQLIDFFHINVRNDQSFFNLFF